MGIRKYRQVECYENTCKDCGGQWESSGEEELCWSCGYKREEIQYRKELGFLLGAEILSVEPHLHGDIDIITVKCRNGKLIKLEADGYNERYIGWEEVDG